MTPMSVASVVQQKANSDQEGYLQDFIISLLGAKPTVRDSRSYLAKFGAPAPKKGAVAKARSSILAPSSSQTQSSSSSTSASSATSTSTNALVTSFLSEAHAAVVKIQGPFTDRQLESICRGMAYLQKLGLVSVIVVDRDDWTGSTDDDGIPTTMSPREQREAALRDMERVVDVLVRLGSEARPILQTTAWRRQSGEIVVGRDELDAIRSAVLAREIPVVPPLAMELVEGGGVRTLRVDANDIVKALVQSMVEAGQEAKREKAAEVLVAANDGKAMSSSDSSKAIAGSTSSSSSAEGELALPPKPPPLDLTPVRIMIINREGGIPSYARQGLPHLTINLSSEYSFINSTFLPSWTSSHPTSLANLSLANTCLSLMPSSSSAVIVSHRSPRALIANLITNKPAHSPSLPHALLDSTGRVTRDTPTLIRLGVPIRIFRDIRGVDRRKLTHLLEMSFGRKLSADAFYSRLERTLDFVIVAGDYVGAAIVTNETLPSSNEPPVCYLDKFAVLPSNQGDGTVDFLWSALRDESFGASLPSALNPTPGSLTNPSSSSSAGSDSTILSTASSRAAEVRPGDRGRDLVWRSRGDNPVNKWYFERSSGFIRLGEGKGWTLFWCDREVPREYSEASEGGAGGWGGVVGGAGEQDEGGSGRDVGRLKRWEEVVGPIPSVWAD